MEGNDKKRGAAADQGKKSKGSSSSGSMRTVFMHGDWVDAALMSLGLIGSVGDGLTLPFTLYILSSIMNHLGSTIRSTDSHFLTHAIDKAVGIIGCVITPHNVYLYSALVQSREINQVKLSKVQEAINYNSIESTMALVVSFFINLFVTTVFAEGFHNTKEANNVGLKNAGRFLEAKYGGGFLPILYLWGIGLLAAGQSSTIAGTYARQFIMEGFFDFKLKQWLRALITRGLAIVPTMVVSIACDTSEAAMDVLNEWLNVVQSMQISFVLIPLFTMVSNEGIKEDGPLSRPKIDTID